MTFLQGHLREQTWIGLVFQFFKLAIIQTAYECIHQSICHPLFGEIKIYKILKHFLHIFKNSKSGISNKTLSEVTELVQCPPTDSKAGGSNLPCTKKVLFS
jgi:hypothetical protein